MSLGGAGKIVDILPICAILQVVPFGEVVQRVLRAQRLCETPSRQRRKQSKRPEPPQRRSCVPFELVHQDAPKVSAGTFAVGVTFLVEQAKRNARKSPGATAGLPSSALGIFFVLQSRPVAWQIDAPHTRRQGEGRLHRSHGGTPRGCSRPYAAAGSFSSGDFSRSVSTAGLRYARSAVPHRSKLPSGNRVPRRLNSSDPFSVLRESTSFRRGRSSTTNSDPGSEIFGMYSKQQKSPLFQHRRVM